MTKFGLLIAATSMMFGASVLPGASFAQEMCGDYAVDGQFIIEVTPPATLNETETSRYGTFSSTWTLRTDASTDASYYSAVWNNGAQARLKILGYNGNRIVLYREDIAGPSVGLHGCYEAFFNASGAVTGGTVQWTFSNGTTANGSWTAS